jgi:hypothetical protein
MGNVKKVQVEINGIQDIDSIRDHEGLEDRGHRSFLVDAF